MAQARQQKRLSKELNDMNGDPVPGVTIDLVQDSIVNWNVKIQGPAGTPYEGGTFIVNVDFSDNYPFKCPNMKFVTKIYHPNIKTETGEICAEAIKNSWVPTLNAQFIIKMLVELISNPNGEAPQEPEIAREFLMNKATFNKNAQEFTEKYAK